MSKHLAAADERFVDDFIAARAMRDCLTDADGPTEGARVDHWAADFLARLWPVCGDGIRVNGEDCDGYDSSACPNLCSPSCTCPVCGNGVKEAGEQCDQGDDAFCVGQCQSDCHCPDQSICGDGVLGPEEQCDGAAATCPNGFECVAPGYQTECLCCRTDVCNYDGYVFLCCPGTHCVPTGGVHTQAVCEPD